MAAGGAACTDYSGCRAMMRERGGEADRMRGATIVPDSRMLSDSDPLFWSGAALGVAFGAVIQWSRLCIVAALSNAVVVRDYRHAAGWIAAIAVTIAGTAWLEASGTVAVAESGYRSATLDWLGADLGGLVFGIGAMLAGGCASRTVVDAGEGNGAAMIALACFALAAYATLFGPLEPLRAALVHRTQIELAAGDASVAALAGVPQAYAAGVAALACAGIALWLARGQRAGQLLAGGVVVGTLVVTGWWITGHAVVDEFSPARPDSLSFSGPLARIALFAIEHKSSGSVFGIGVVAGTLAGSLVTAAARRTLALRRPPREQVVRSIIGGALMGIGGVLAGGCNVGHALTGIGTLSVKSVMATGAILVGMGLVLAWMERARDVPALPQRGTAR